MKRNSVLILCPSPRGTAATQRLKYEQYLEMLEEKGYHFTISSFQTRRFWKIIYKPGFTVEKIFWTLIGYVIRTFDLMRAPFYDAVFVNLWVTPLGLPFFERVLFFMNRNVIYDIDDMIFLEKFEHVKENIFQRLKGRRKPMILMKYSRAVITCTPRLTEIALDINRNRNVTDISSTINTERFQPVHAYTNKETTILGWTGTHSTIPFLETISQVLQQVYKERKVKLLVIANREYQMPGIETIYQPWNESTEVQDLHKMDIGLYPIPANEFSLGKSSLKALTYMSVGIPVVATAYGTNFRVVEHGVQGFLAANDEEWKNRIIELIDNVSLRERMGKAGRKKVEDEFSVNANFPKYLQVFKSVIPNNE
jgi:L-malate glycosyltransferase